jgi:hypothetical protein
MDSGWAYVAMVDRLTNGDITKDNDVLQLEYIYCLTRLLYWKDKDEWTDKMNKINQKKRK